MPGRDALLHRGRSFHSAQAGRLVLRGYVESEISCLGPRSWPLAPGDWIADRNEWPRETVYGNSPLSFRTRRCNISGEVILSFALPGLYLNITKTEEISQFWGQNVSRRHSSARGSSAVSFTQGDSRNHWTSNGKLFNPLQILANYFSIIFVAFLAIEEYRVNDSPAMENWCRVWLDKEVQRINST